ncbi:hypothetical protein EXE58_18815 [Nocardioides seonyuensis]|uniref:Uncharacterized protein n=1 Tax=Nocardioides seonyuensis TaxID=2518371 RepID=A0A4P7IIT5_9ACTN|nr:hypothetical protein EXE58_18815 [Nocardioides seonyuensis]
MGRGTSWGWRLRPHCPSPGGRPRSRCDNTAKWLHEFGHGNAGFRANQLVLVDEATLAGTTTLHRISGLAAAAGAKVLLVGTRASAVGRRWRSLRAPGWTKRPDAAQLPAIHRTRNEWEKAA